jgi:hypothetical protein
MKPAPLLELLETAAAAADVKVSYEQLGHFSHIGHGGLCRVKGQYRVIIDRRATAGERIQTLASALASALSPEQIAGQPAKVRDAIEQYAPRKAS